MPIPSSRPSELRFGGRPRAALLFVVAAWASACAPRPLRTADAPPPEQSAGIAVDPIAAVPPPTDRAVAGDGVVTLRAPVATEAVMALVRRVFEAFHSRDTAVLDDDLDDSLIDVRAENPMTRSRSQFLYDLQMRLKGTSAFEQLDVDAMYRPQDVEIYARDELGLPGRPARPALMGADDLLVRVPIATPRLGADVLFGDEIRLLLRRDGARYRIRGYGEVVPR